MEKSSVDILWLIVASALVFVMRAGFALLESGLVRTKNSINVSAKVLSDLGISLLTFWAAGFALMFGLSQAGLFGATHFAPKLDTTWFAVFFLFHAMFASTSATIVSGAVAERMKFGAYLFATFFFSALIYPVVGHWVWNTGLFASGQGWLSKLGFADFAGSTAVHSVGGWMSLAAILVLGPRIGKYNADGSANRVTGSNTQTAIVGTILLWFGWIGFNGGSTLSLSADVPSIIVKTSLAGAAGMVMTLLVGWLIRRYADIGLLVNGALAGLVAVTASAPWVTEGQALLIGAIGGLFMLAVEWFLDLYKIDDAVGAVPVHLGAGVWGTLAAGIFGNLQLMGSTHSRGGQIAVQILGIVAAAAWSFITAYVLLKIVNRFFPLRVSAEAETEGLNISEHRASTEIYDLSAAMEELSETGDLSRRVHEEPFTEFGQIARRYNRVLDHLESNLVARSEYLRILDNVSDGLFLLDPDFRMSNFYSKTLESILERTDLPGQDFLSLLSSLVPESASQGIRDYFGLLFSPRTTASTLDRLNPLEKLEIFIDQGDGRFMSKFVSVRFKRILEGGKVVRLMGIVRDITEQVRLGIEVESVRQTAQTEMEMFYRILHLDRRVFEEFIGSLHEELTRVNSILEKHPEGQEPREILDEIFRHIHTVKGDARLLELDFFAEKAHSFEERIVELKKKKAVQNEDFLPLAVMLSSMYSLATQMKSLLERFSGLASPETGRQSSEELIALSVRNCIEVASREQGKSVDFRFQDFRTEGIPRELRKPLRDIMVHLARNAVSHGIEPPAEREKLGKPAAGKIEIASEVSGGHLRVLIRDDGQGIDYDALREKASKLGVLPPEQLTDRKNLVSLLFQTGSSTTETPDKDSGRGMGLNIVWRMVNKWKGTITLACKRKEFCEFRLTLPLPAE